MTKDEIKDRMKSKISMALKDPVLQLAFEIICKENSELRRGVNEWHYPSKGEYPKECENVLCYCKIVNVQFYAIGHTVIGGDNKIRWWSNDRSEKLKVYAWKDITPPKEVKENEN